MKVLIACEFSGIVREAFNQRGHRATSADLLPTEIPGDHYQGDVLEILDQGWDLMIAHPPCTYLANSGVCWLKKDPSRWAKMDAASNFFYQMLGAPIPKICVENPIPHGHACLPNYTQIIHPWQFGHMEQKPTCLWLKGLPPLFETNNVKEEMMKLPANVRQRIHYIGPGKNRQKERSRTFLGIGWAMADQWGSMSDPDRCEWCEMGVEGCQN